MCTTAAAAVKNTLLSLIFNVDFRSFSTDQMVDCHALIHLTYAKTWIKKEFFPSKCMYILVAYIYDMLEVKVKIVQTHWANWNPKSLVRVWSYSYGLQKNLTRVFKFVFIFSIMFFIIDLKFGVTLDLLQSCLCRIHLHP